MLSWGRVRFAMVEVLQVMDQDRKHVKATDMGLTMLVRMARRNEAVAEWIGTEVEKVEPVRQMWYGQREHGYTCRKELRCVKALCVTTVLEGYDRLGRRVCWLGLGGVV
jgi:hypothetical protein